MKLSFHPEVINDLRGHFTYYSEIDPELGLGFIEAYRDALDFVKRAPLTMRTFYKNERRMPFKRFKSIALIYEVVGGEVCIKAVADLRRRPHFWSIR